MEMHSLPYLPHIWFPLTRGNHFQLLYLFLLTNNILISFYLIFQFPEDEGLAFIKVYLSPIFPIYLYQNIGLNYCHLYYLNIYRWPNLLYIMIKFSFVIFFLGQF